MSEQETFNLIDEPWIIARFTNGSTEEVSLRSLFKQWNTIVEILGDIPTQAFAIYRLSLAIMYRSAVLAQTPIAHVEDWEQYWENPDLFGNVISDYLDKWYDRFDLLDEREPFFQVAGLHSGKNEVSSLERIVLDSPVGGHFANRTAQGLARISCAEAARWLVHSQAYDTAGIKTGAAGDPRVNGGRTYGSSVGWAGQIGGILLRGSNLFQTLLLNLIPLDLDSSPLGSILIEDDLPPWEQEPFGPGIRDGKESIAPTGPVDLYTWQSRRIRLVGSTRGITGVLLAQGDKLTPQNRQTIEPMTVWRYSRPQSRTAKQHVYMPRIHESSRLFWRGLGAAIPQISCEGTINSYDKKSRVQGLLSPATLIWHSQLINLFVVDPKDLVPMEIFGIEYGVQNSVVENGLNDTLVFPAELLLDSSENARNNLVKALAIVERVANILGEFARNLALASGATGRTSEENQRNEDKVKDRFFFQIDQSFRRWLIQTSESAAASLISWQRYLLSVSEEFLSELVSSAPANAAVGHQIQEKFTMDLGTAERKAYWQLRKAIPDAFTTKEASNHKPEKEEEMA